VEEIITVSDSLWVGVSTVSLEYDGLFTIRDDGGNETLVDRTEIPALIEALQKVAEKGQKKEEVMVHQTGTLPLQGAYTLKVQYVGERVVFVLDFADPQLPISHIDFSMTVAEFQEFVERAKELVFNQALLHVVEMALEDSTEWPVEGK
jgi:hypothetical protein